MCVCSPDLLILLFVCRMRVDIVQLSYEEMVFDLVGVDAAIANAIRRLLLAEVCHGDLRIFNSPPFSPPSSTLLRCPPWL